MHFEIPVSDSDRISKFYSDLFDWKFSKQSMPGMDYWMIQTTGGGMTDLQGGMYMKQGDPSDKPRFYISVEDIDHHTERFKDAGGSVLIEKQEVPGFGWAVIGTDPEGNVLGLFQPIQPAVSAARSPGASRKRSSTRAKKKPVSRSSSKKSKK